jgi:adenylate kinase
MCGQGHIYNLRFNPPQVEGICDLDGSSLFQRDDDQEQTVIQRIQVYQKQTMPLIEYYKGRGLLVEIDGDQPIDSVTTALMSAVEESTE